MIDPASYQNARQAADEAKQHQSAGRNDDAKALYRRAFELDPEDADTVFSFGVFCRETGDLNGAASLIERVVQMLPNSPEAWLELTRVRHDLAHWKACADAAGHTLTLDGSCTEAALMQAVALFALHQHEAATRAIEPVAAQLPDDAGVQLFHTRCLMACNMFAEAYGPASRAAALAPQSADAQYLFGACLKRNGRNEAAEAALQVCLDHQPEHYEALNDLADIYFARGDTQAGLGCLRKSHAARPYNLDAISGLCFYTAFDPHSSAADLFDINREWSLRLPTNDTPPDLQAPNLKRPDSRIRVGYLAYDLFDHVTSWFMEPVLARHDHGRFHVTGYYGNTNVDHVTERLGSYTDSWQDIASDTIAETAERIRRDNIDILVLGSFFRGKDRRILAYRSAPLQVGYHNRVASTGLDTTDYIITEPVSDPPGEVEAHYTEALVRITNHNVYLPPQGAPPPAPPPCLKNGYVTFGSFNNLAKISDKVIETWARILHQIPTARLLLRSSIHFDNATTRAYFRQRFSKHGIEISRLEFQGLKALRTDHLAGMHDVDIALDPFPCNGGTTSCEALWMGLPLVTLETDSYMGRQGASYLAKLGLMDLVARNEADYVNIAVRLAQNEERIAHLHTTLRTGVEAEIFAYDQHILELETAYCHMIDRYRAGKPPIAFDVRDNSVTESEYFT